LHDGLGQELTGLSYLATSLHRKLRSGNFAEADTAAELSAGIPRVLGQVQGIVKGLVPLGVGAEDLVPALQLLATNVEERTGVSCSFESDGPESDGPVKVRDDNVAVQLYRIAQEAVTNAVKHAGATLIAVAIKADRGCITLQVSDDGVGVPPGDETNSGSGMHIMRYRARVIGGTLEIKPATGGGTLVTCSLPWE
jgi:two-component system sensor kinase FixL